MKTTVKIFYLAICCSIGIFATSCNPKQTKGDGNVISKEIPIDIYNQIEVEGAVDIEYEAKPDEAAYLRIEADDNIIALIELKSKGGKLSIKVEDNIIPSRFVVHTNSPSLKAVESKGNSIVYLKGAIAGTELKVETKGTSNLKADNLVYEKSEFKLNGANEMELAGQCNVSKMEIKGTGNINAVNFVVGDLECKLNGVGNVTINAVEKLSIEIKGKGTVNYKGNPQITKQKIKGAGSVKAI